MKLDLLYEIDVPKPGVPREVPRLPAPHGHAKPVQDPHPPCWMAATSDGSAAVAGRLGLGLLSFSILQPLDKMAAHIAQYRSAAADPDPLTRVTTNKVAAYTLVHCADTMAQCEANGIWDSVWWWYKHLAEFTLEWEFPNIPESERDSIFPLLKRQLDGDFDPHEFNDADMIVVGDPEQCLAKMRKYAGLGVDQLICYVQFGHLEHEAIAAHHRAPRHRIDPEPRSRGRRRRNEGDRVMTRTDDSPVPDYPGLLRLDGRRFVVLGAGQGIGRQASHALASVGARLACVDQEVDLASDIAAEVGGTALSGNAYDRADMERMFDDAGRALGGIDGVVDIIGMARYADITELSDEDWNWHFDIVLRHAFLAMQYGGRAMQEHGGAMVFVASVSGITSAPRHSAYGAAKAGLMSLVRTGAVELGPSGIRVNAVAPGVVWTPADLGLHGRGRSRAQHREHAAAARRAAGRHRRRAPLPRVRSLVVRHRPDVVGGRRGRGQVPVPDGRSVTAGTAADPFVRGCAWSGTDDVPVSACRSRRSRPAPRRHRRVGAPPGRCPSGARQ